MNNLVMLLEGLNEVVETHVIQDAMDHLKLQELRCVNAELSRKVQFLMEEMARTEAYLLEKIWSLEAENVQLRQRVHIEKMPYAERTPDDFMASRAQR